MIHEQMIAWKPKTKSRPRVTKYGTYTDALTLAAEKAIAEQYNGPKFEGPLSVGVEFFNTELRLYIVTMDDYVNRKLTGDVDNYGKLVLDGLNTIAYEDDKQIRSLSLHKN